MDPPPVQLQRRHCNKQLVEIRDEETPQPPIEMPALYCSISASPAACPLRGYGRAGAQNARLGVRGYGRAGTQNDFLGVRGYGRASTQNDRLGETASERRLC